MEAHGLVEKVKNKQVNDDGVIQWCEENLENIDLNNAEHVFLYDARVADSKFYHENYDNLVLENQANKVWLNKGIFRNSKVCPTAIEIL